MSQYQLNEQIKTKWKPVLEHESIPAIKDSYRKNVTNIVLENMTRFQAQKNGQAINEDVGVPQNITGGTGINSPSATMAGWDPILISLVRRSTPNLLAFDIAGVQPMTGPTGLMFAIRARYGAPNGTEALFNEADSDYSGTGTHGGDTSGFATGDLGVGAPATPTTKGTGMTVASGEQLGATGSGGTPATWGQMSFSIERTSVTAKTRALRASYSTELAQDLRAIHGLDAEAELANILTTEILAEQNREMIRTINICAKLSTSSNVTNATFDVSAVAGGLLFSERFKGLLFQLELEANAIGKATRRGRGNFILCSSDVASALAMSGLLNYAPALSTALTVDDTGNLFAGTLNGRIKVYVDPYATTNYITCGYRGANQYDAGVFFAPYVPLEMSRAVSPDDFQPLIGFKTRYGIAANPFADVDGSNVITTGYGLGSNTNIYYRKFKVTNIV